MLKVELHTHTADDPVDSIPHTTFELIDRAAELKYDAVAITLHDRQLNLTRFDAYASERGITLIPGIERTIEGRHVLLLNFRRGAEEVRSFDDLAALKRRERGLVVAPHPFFPWSTCLRGHMLRHADLFDAIEWNAMYTSVANFNWPAMLWAKRYGKPVVGNGDVHRLRQLGSTFSMIDAEPHPDAICDAIAAGRVCVDSQPLAISEAAGLLSELLLDEMRTPHPRSIRSRGQAPDQSAI